MNIPNLASRHQAIFSSWLNFFCCGWANTFTVNSNNKTIDKTFFMVCECYSLFKFRLIFCVKTTTLAFPFAANLLALENGRHLLAMAGAAAGFAAIWALHPVQKDPR